MSHVPELHPPSPLTIELLGARPGGSAREIVSVLAWAPSRREDEIQTSTTSGNEW